MIILIKNAWEAQETFFKKKKRGKFYFWQVRKLAIKNATLGWAPFGLLLTHSADNIVYYEDVFPLAHL